MHTGREAIAFMATGVALIFLATTFFLLKRNIDLGRDFLNQAVQTTDNASSQAINESFENFESQPQKIPASGAYVLLTYNQDHVKSITCYICNPSGKKSETLENSCLKKHLTGDVKVWTEMDSGDGRYNVYISSDLNLLTKSEKIMSPAEVRSIVTTNKKIINSIECTKCNKTYGNIENSCLFDNTHAKSKSIKISAIFNYATQKYTIYIGE